MGPVPRPPRPRRVLRAAERRRDPRGHPGRLGPLKDASREHPWDVSADEAAAIQEALAHRVERADRLGPVHRVGGVDAAEARERGELVAAAVVLRFPELTLVDHARARAPLRFPYRPGLLAFRELPAVLAALDALDSPPDLILTDGHGLAHPNRFGLACHLGVLRDVPTIGVAKRPYLGTFEAPGPQRGARALVIDAGEVVGAVLRTRTGVRPVYVSTGHRVSLETALDYALACAPRYRLPETTRWANRLARAP